MQPWNPEPEVDPRRRCCLHVRVDELVVPSELCRNRMDPDTAVDVAVWLIEHMCDHIGVRDLGDLDVLDFGCGVRFTQALLNRCCADRALRRRRCHPREVIDFLRANVSDPHFEHFHLDAQNDRYNPNGQPLAEMTVPEVEGRRFDLICLFSVFTHLAPADYVAMLRLLRRFVRPEGRLFYTLFINETTAGGHGYIDRMRKALGGVPRPSHGRKPRAHASPRAANHRTSVTPFRTSPSRSRCIPVGMQSS